MIQRVLLFVNTAVLIAACSTRPIPTALPPPNQLDSVNAEKETAPPAGATPLPTPSETPTPVILPTETPTELATRTAVHSPQATLAPAPTLTFQGLCGQLANLRAGGLFLFYLQAYPELKWDMEPREFRVGVCNSLPVAIVPESDFIVSMRLVDNGRILGQTPHLARQLEPGLSELVLGPWTPGLENHQSICTQRAVVDIELGYSDQPGSRNYRPVPWLDGKTSHLFPVKCGGDFAQIKGLP